jgi:hypothetical protein
MRIFNILERDRMQNLNPLLPIALLASPLSQERILLRQIYLDLLMTKILPRTHV